MGLELLELEISKTFNRVWYAGLLHKYKFYGISGQTFGLISSFLSNRQSQVVLDGNSSQEYQVNAGVPQCSSFLHYTLMTFLVKLFVILLSMLMMLLTNVSVIRYLIYGNN